MGTTPKGLRYPAPTDPIHRGAQRIQELAEDVDGVLDTIATGPEGPAGPAGGTDAATASWLDGGTLTRPVLEAKVARKTDHMKLLPFYAALDARNTAKVDIGVMGPSTVEGYLTPWSSTIPQALARRLRNRFPITGNLPTQGGTGVIGIPSGPVRGVGATASPATTPWTFTAGMQFDETVYSQGVTHTLAFTNGVESGSITTDRDLTSWKVTHTKGPAGHATAGYVQANALTPISFSTLGAGVVTDTVITASQLGFASGVIPAGTVIKTGCSGTGYLLLSHVEGFYNDETKGIHVHNIGHSGYDALDWSQAVTGATVLPTIAALGLDLLVLDFFGINAGSTGRSYAAGGSRTAAQWKTEMTALIAQLRSAGVTCPIVLVESYDVTGPVTFATPGWINYVNAAREISDADATIAFYDHELRMPASAASSTFGLYNVDQVHLTSAGNLRITDGLLSYLLDQLEGGIVGDALPAKADLVNGSVPQSQLAFHGLPLLDWASGSWNESQYSGRGTATTATPTLGAVYYDLIYVPNAVTISAIGARSSGASATQVYNLGLYANTAGKPGARLVGASVAAPAAAAYQVSTGSLALTPGFYWTAMLVTVATTGTAVVGGGAVTPYRGDTTLIPSVITAASVGYMQTGQTSLPANATPVAATDTQQTRPRVALLVA